MGCEEASQVLARQRAVRWPALAAALLPSLAQASLLSGEALDTAADVISWVALIIVPVAVITVFWLVHILPEKIAEKKNHPQAKAIQVMCLLSLVFGGMLWPIAWLWAYSKPVFHKMAYGTDGTDIAAEPQASDAPPQASDAPPQAAYAEPQGANAEPVDSAQPVAIVEVEADAAERAPLQRG